MTVADQPNKAQGGPPYRRSAPPLRDFLPPEPHLELPTRHTHWLDLFENHPPTPPAPTSRNHLPPPKPTPDVVDWLIMETLEQKGAPPAPPPRPGEPDLLDALVKDHLERASAPAQPPTASTPAPLTPPATTPATDADSMLQREIDALLTAPTTTPPAADPAPQPAPESSALAPEVTQAELDVLIPPAPAEPSPVLAAPQTPAAGPLTDVDDETASKLNEAEGVLAEELAQLMAETDAAEKDQPKLEPAPEKIPAPSEPAATIAPTHSEPEPVSTETAPTTIAESPTATPTEPVTAPLPANMPPPVVILLPEPDPDEELDQPVPRFQLASLFHDLSLMIAQLVDIPFGWIDVVNKNLLGLAAILFLISGAALMTAAWWLAR